jgi:hypothetical protein
MQNRWHCYRVTFFEASLCRKNPHCKKFDEKFRWPDQMTQDQNPQEEKVFRFVCRETQRCRNISKFGGEAKTRNLEPTQLD